LKIEKQKQQAELKLRMNELMMRVQEIEELKPKQDVKGVISYFDIIKADVRRRKQELEVLKETYFDNVAKYKRLMHIESPPVYVPNVRTVEQKRVEYKSVVRSKKDMGFMKLPVTLSEEVPVDDFKLLTEVEDSLRKNLISFAVNDLTFLQETVQAKDLKNVLSRRYDFDLKLGIYECISVVAEMKQNKLIK